MYCRNCGTKNIDTAKFCCSCGARIGGQQVAQNRTSSQTGKSQILQGMNQSANSNMNYYQNRKNVSNSKQKATVSGATMFKTIIILILLGVIVITIIGILNVSNDNKVYFSDKSTKSASKNGGIQKNQKEKPEVPEQPDEPESPKPEENNTQQNNSNNRNRTSKYKTVVEVDHYYANAILKSKDDAIALVKKDSESQKSTTSKEIQEIENRIINNYKVKAVNLGEMDLETAKGVEDAVKYIYDNFPGARDHLATISIGNMSAAQGQGTIAYFGPLEFASSSTGYPIVTRNLMCLNARYFLDIPYLERAIEQSSKAGHFPKNTNKYAVVIHESGHFLTLVATMKKYGLNDILYVDDSSAEKFQSVIIDWSNNTEPLSIINEAYNNYKSKYNDNISLDEFRASISKYAMAKDDSGEYIYHETVAEAFHDCYANGDNAAKASIEIMEVLKKRLN